MNSEEIITGYLSFSFLANTSNLGENIDCIFPTSGKPKQGWFDLFKIAEHLDFKFNFSVHITRPEALIHVRERKSYSLFADLGLIQLLVYAHPKLDEKVRTYTAWQLYDNSPMCNGFFGKEKITFQYTLPGFHSIEFKPRSKKSISFLVY